MGCPLVATVQDIKIHNSGVDAGAEESEPDDTPFSTDFAQSCNNAFTQWWQPMAGARLAGTASKYCGLNRPWDIGLGSKSTYFTMPREQSGSELAEELYGKGRIEANPLPMASIAATVDAGSVPQPYLVSGITDKATATPLPSSVKSQLYTVMRKVVTSGTAATVLRARGLRANHDGNTNGWMAVFDPAKDIAIGCVVVDSGFGADTAGPETHYVLHHLPERAGRAAGALRQV